MVSRRRILSRSRDDLNLDNFPEEEDDVWHIKEKLYKVSTKTSKNVEKQNVKPTRPPGRHSLSLFWLLFTHCYTTAHIAVPQVQIRHDCVCVYTNVGCTTIIIIIMFMM